MKKRFSLLLAVVLVAAMLLPLIPVISIPAAAADDDIVAEIYIAGESTPKASVKRSEFVSSFTTSWKTNIVSMDGSPFVNKDVVINLLSDIDVGTGQCGFFTFPGKTVTINGDPDGDGKNVTITGSNDSNPALRVYSYQTNTGLAVDAALSEMANNKRGTVVFDSVDYTKTKNNGLQFYQYVNIDLVDCHWYSAGNGLCPSGSGTVNLKDGTVLAAQTPMMLDWAANGDKNTNIINIEEGAKVISFATEAIRLSAFKNASASLTINLNGGIVYGDVLTKVSNAAINLNSGKLSGATSGSGITVGDVENFYVAEVYENGVLTKSLTQKEVISTFTNYTVSANTVVKLLDNVYAYDAQFQFKPQAGVTLTIDGDPDGDGVNALIYGVGTSGNPNVRTHGPGKVIFDRVDYTKTSSTAMQFYAGTQTEIIDSHWIAGTGFMFAPSDANNSVITIKGNSVLESGSHFVYTGWISQPATINVQDGATVISDAAIIMAHANAANVTLNVSNAGVIGSFVDTTAKVNISNSFVTGSTANATVSNVVADPTVVVNGTNYDTFDAAVTAATASETDVVIRLFKDQTTKNNNLFYKAKANITVDGFNGERNVMLTFTGEGNNIRWNTEAKTFTLRNINIESNSKNGCFFQLAQEDVAKSCNAVWENVDLASYSKWYVVNTMAKDGKACYFTMKDCHVVANLTNGSYFYSTGNDGNHAHHSVVKIVDSIISANGIVQVNKCSTADIIVENSTLVSDSTHLFQLGTPTSLHASAVSTKTTLTVDNASVLAPAPGKNVANGTASATVIINVPTTEAKVVAKIGDTEYTSFVAAFDAAATAQGDVTIKLLADGVVNKVVTFTGTGNVTVDGDLGNGRVAKLYAAVEGNNFRWNVAGKTLTFKNLDLYADAYNGCVFQMSQNACASNNLTLDNVDLYANVWYQLINSMANDGGSPVVTINNSNVEVGFVGSTNNQHGYIVTTGNNNDHPHNLIFNVTDSTLVSAGIVISNEKSSADVTVVNSDLVATAWDGLYYIGSVAGSSANVDMDSTITVPAGKKEVNATAPETTVFTPYDVFLEIYDADTDALLHTVMRKDFNATMTEQAGSNNLTNKETAAGKNLRIEIRRDFEIENLDDPTNTKDPIGSGGYAIGFWANNGKTVTVNGNGYKITSLRLGGKRSSYFTGNGTVVLNGVYLHNTGNSSIGQYYNGVTVEAYDCTFISDKHMGFYLTGNGTLKLLGNTTLKTASNAINVVTGSANTVEIGENVILESTENTLNLGNTGAITINANGTIKAAEGKNAVALSNANITLNITGTVNGKITMSAGTVNIGAAANFARSATEAVGTVNGDISVAGGALNVIGGTINGNTKVTDGTVSVAEGTITGNVEIAGGDVTVAGGAITGDVTVSGGAVEVKAEAALTGNLTVSAGNVTLDNATLAGDVTATGGKVTVNDSSISGDIDADKGTFEVESGVISGTNGAYEIVDGIVFDGAAIRLRNDYTNGLRFINTISKALIDKINAAKDAETAVEYGTIVFPKKYIDEAGLTVVTHAALIDAGYTADKIVDIAASNGLTIDADGNITLSAAIIEIKGSHYEWEFISVAYAKYVKDGKAVYAYSNVNADELVANAKSVKSVSEAALADTQEEAGGDYRFPYNGAYTKYSPSKIKVLEAFTGIGEMPVAPEKPSTPPEVHKHTYTENVTAPTCFEPGYTTYTCACGFSYTGAETDPKHDAITHVAASAATCTENGNIEYWFCETCGDAWLDEECLRNTNLKAVVLPAGHVDANEDYKCDGCSTKMLPEADSYLTVKQAIAVAKAAGSSYTTDKYFVTGIVTGVYNTQYGNMYLKDDAGNKLGVYGLYTWDKAVRYDAMPYKPVEGDELVIYTVLGTYNSNAQGKDAWMDDVVAHEHTYVDVVKAPTCTNGGYTTHTCSICNYSFNDTEVGSLGHTTEAGTCERCGQEIGGDAPVAKDPVTFEFGANGSAAHVDGNAIGSSKTYTEGSATLKLTDMANIYGPAYDAKGNSCIKLGTSSKAGSGTITVDADVTSVVIKIAKYKTNTTKITINGASYILSKNSNDGAYDEIVIDTTTTKTITFATMSGGYRAMINSITYNYD